MRARKRARCQNKVITMAEIKIWWADQHLKGYAKKIDQISTRFPKALPRLVNQVGNRAKTQVIRNLTKQTGLPRKTIVKAIGNPITARPTRLSYSMITAGGNIRLKYLSPRETRKGVTAKPWGKRTLYAGSFMKGGAFPNRKVVAKFDGHVYRRLGRGMRTDGSYGEKLTQVRSGMFIPVEMTSGATAKAFEQTAAPLLQQRVDALIRKLAP